MELELRKSLLISAQRALLGAVPSTLRAVSLGVEGQTIVFRAVFEPGASEDDRELLSVAATEVLADFPAPWTIREEFIDLSAVDSSQNLPLKVFARAG